MSGAASPSARPVHPTDPFSTSQLLVIEQALCEAWRRMRRLVEIAVEREAVLNAALVTQLDELLFEESVPGFTNAGFQTPIRGGELEDATGKRIEVRPDIRLTPTCNPGHPKQYWALFIECKIVDRHHPIRAYANEGLRRFIEGSYAWAVRQGMMVAYVRGGEALESLLTEELAKKPVEWRWVRPHRTPPGSRCCETTHERMARENIAVRHLALAV